jgi:hypothetical protein
MMQRCGTSKLVFACLAVTYLLLAPCAPIASLLRAQTSTDERLIYPGWWPRHSTPSSSEYIGPAECAKCHPGKAAEQKNTPMARTAALVADSDILASHSRLTFQAGRINYDIARSEGKTIYTVTDGTRSISAPLTWSFGDGRVGQSYLFEREGNLYESRVSYFGTLKALEFTPGRKLTEPRDLEQAMARPVTGDEIVRCFACHTTSSTINEKFERDRIIPGITCEACHGPGLNHAAAEEMAYLQGSAGEIGHEADLIFDPSKLNPVDAVDFCGACHGTWWDVKLGNLEGLANLRAQPYRLEKSRCWGKKGDARLTCVACHDPHQELVRDSASYDKKCLSCHIASISMRPTSNHPGPACKVGTKNCTSCHMPKYLDPGMHFTFTDHDIRVARQGAPYPD